MKRLSIGARAVRRGLGAIIVAAGIAVLALVVDADEARAGGRSPIKEVVVGAGGHDVGVFGRRKESGADFNAEIRFLPFEWQIWSWIFSPTPHIGVHFNTDGNTNQVFVGGNWLFDFGGGIFGGGSLGFALHDGELDSNTRGRKDLGLPVLFRESIEIGFRFNENNAISLMLDHISNASIGDQNEGLDTVGLRYAFGL